MIRVDNKTPINIFPLFFLQIKGTEQEEAASQPILTGREQIQESRKQEDNAPSKLPQGVESMTTSA